MGAKTREIVDNAKKEGRKKLFEHEALAVLEDYEIPVAPFAFARNSKEALEKVAKIGYPVVVKIVSPDIIHKSDVGGVVVGVKNDDELEKAIESIEKNVHEKQPDARITGFLIQKMLEDGLEVIVGGIRDPVFDSVVMFGLGGVFVEVFKDVSFRIAPIDKKEALKMINEVKSKSLLEGYRGMPPRDKEAIADILVKVSKVLEENKDIIEMDINPVISLEKGAFSVDSRIILSLQ
jgi:acyl-CoA synthetase (NDP forming)